MSWDGFLSEKLKNKDYYARKTEAKKDILSAINCYRDLAPTEDVYVYNNGARQKFLCLDGTIPVNYKGSTYNIPIKVWLVAGHPYKPPLAYVTPTSGMVIKPGKHVDQSGRVYHPYMTDWSYPKSSLKQLLATMCVIFSQDCPVYSKPTPTAIRPPQQQWSGSTPYPSSQPGYPSQINRMPMPGMPFPGAQPPATYPGQQNYPATSTTPYPAYSTATTSPYPAPYQQQQQPSADRTPTRQPSVIDDKLIQASLLSSVEDKLKRRAKEVFELGNMELENLEAKRVELEQGSKELQSHISKMKQDKSTLESNIEMLKKKNEEITANIEKMKKSSENMDIDESVVTNAPLYTQIMNLFAEESSVEDAIYYTGDALRREVIDIDVFLKTVRKLSRKQFMLRATLQKARSTAGLEHS